MPAISISLERNSSRCPRWFGIAASVMLAALIGFMAGTNINTQVLVDACVGSLNGILMLLLS